MTKTLTVASASGLKKEIKTSVNYEYGVFESAINNKTGETREWFLGFSRDYVAAEKKGSDALDINKIVKEKRYSNITKEIVKTKETP